MDEPVVKRAQPGSVVEGGFSAFAPPDDVVAVGRRSTTAWEGALASLFEPGGSSYGGGEAAGADRDVEHIASGVEDGGEDLGVAGEPAGGRGADGGAGGQPPPGVVHVVDER